MKRRGFLKKSVAAGLTVGVTPVLALAETKVSCEGVPQVVHSISANHGHEVTLSLAEALRMLQTNHPFESFELNIQGRSRHPHRITLSFDDLLKLFVAGQIEIESTTDAGHSHLVQIQIELGD